MVSAPGTTTVEAKSGYGLSLEDELKILRAIKRLGQGTRCVTCLRFWARTLFRRNIVHDASEYVSLIIDEMLPRVARRSWLSIAMCFVKQKVFTIDESRQNTFRRRARHGLGLRIHADQLSLSGGAKLAAELRTATADHLEHTDADGIAALKSAGVQPVLLPGSVYALGSSRVSGGARND